MVKFSLPVYYHFGLMVKHSAFPFSYDLAFRIRPNGSVRFEIPPVFTLGQKIDKRRRVKTEFGKNQQQSVI